MRILLTSPASSSVFSHLGLNLPPLGLLYIAAVLEERGHQVTVKDYSVAGSPGRRDFQHVDLVGITSDTYRIGKALRIARLAGAAGAKVVLGGPHSHYCDEEVLKTGLVHFIVRGEGEETILELVDALAAGTDFSQVRGLTFVDGPPTAESRTLVRTDDRPPLRNLECLPFPARHLIDPKRYLRTQIHGRTAASITTSRGCPSNCHFCSVPDFVGRKLRYRTLDNVMEEIDLLYQRFGYRALAFLDDNFTVNTRWATAIAEEIIRRGYDLHLWMFSRPDTIVKNPDMIQRLAEAGTRTIFLGIESGNEETLNTFNKRCTPNVAGDAVRLLKENGIETTGAYILGSENDDSQSIRNLIRFARQLNTETAQFSILTPFPGTRIFDDLEERLKTRDWSQYDGLRLVFDHPNFPGRSLERWLIRANFSYYLRSVDSVRRLVTFWRARRKIA